MWIVTFDRSVADSLDLIIFVGLWHQMASRYGWCVALPMWLDRWLTCAVALW